MRRLAAALSFVVLMCTVTAFAEDTKARSFVMRSDHYESTITVEPLTSGQVAYEASIKDRTTLAILAQPRVTAAPETEVDLTGENEGVKFVIHLQPHPQAILAKFEAQRDGNIIDRVTAGWNFGPVKHLDAPGAMRVGGDVKAPVVLNRVNPIYSEAARRDRIAGIVIVEVLIDKSGKVADAMVLKDMPDGLGQAAVDAVKQWTFQPGTLNGEPVDVIFNLTMNFKLDDVKPSS